MSDIEPSRDEATGQFTNSEPLFGREAELVVAGYTVKKDPAPVERAYGSDESSLRDAGEDQASGREKPLELSVSELQEFVGKPDLNEAVTVKQAADERSLLRADLQTYVDNTGLNKLAAEVDAKRAEAIDGDPDLEKHYGVKDPIKDAKAPDQEPATQAADQTASSDAVDPIDAIDGLHPETRKALKIPQVREALEQEFSQIDAAKQSYAEGLRAAQQFAQLNLVDDLPELANIPLENWQTAVTLLHQQDPQRVQAALGELQRVDQLNAATAQWQQLQAAEQQRQFEAWRQEYGRKSDEALGPMTAAEKIQMVEELVDYVGEFGVTREQFAREAQTNLTLHHPAFQKMAADAIAYRRLKAAPAKAIPKPVPPVSRPGTSNGPRVSSATLASLQAELAGATGKRALKIAAQITQARRKAS